MMLTFFTMIVLVAICGGISAAMPWLMPPTECFSVTVPPSVQKDARVVALKRSYTTTIMVVTALCALGLALVVARIGATPSESGLALLSGGITVAVLLPIVVGFALMQRYRTRMQELKQAEGWISPTQRSSAPVGDDVPKPLSLAWNLLYVPLILAMAAVALLSYDRFPEQIPMNVDFSGNVSAYAPKSVGAVLFPALFTAFMGSVFTFAHWMIAVSKRPVDPAAPATSTLAYARFARLQSLALLVGGLLLSAGTGIMFYLSSLGIVSLSTASAALMLFTAVVVIGVVVISAITGQSGGRLASELRTSDDLARDDDAHWRLGVFYCNAEDPSIVVPKRFGIGWTINIARPGAWAVFGAFILGVMAFTLLLYGITG